MYAYVYFSFALSGVEMVKAGGRRKENAKKNQIHTINPASPGTDLAKAIYARVS